MTISQIIPRVIEHQAAETPGARGPARPHPRDGQGPLHPERLRRRDPRRHRRGHRIQQGDDLQPFRQQGRDLRLRSCSSIWTSSSPPSGRPPRTGRDTAERLQKRDQSLRPFLPGAPGVFPAPVFHRRRQRPGADPGGLLKEIRLRKIACLRELQNIVKAGVRAGEVGERTVGRPSQHGLVGDAQRDHPAGRIPPDQAKKTSTG